MLVKEIMTKGVKTVTPETSVRDVAMVMCLQKISGLPVVDEEGAIVGIVSEKDVLQKMFPDMGEAMTLDVKPDFEKMEDNYTDALSLKAGDLMTANVSTVEPDMPCLKAASMMWLRKIRRIPVTEGNKLVGIVSLGDVHKAVFQQHLVNQVS
ncbi:MAG TPA: CBS domain-containing protein [Gammaproteobacteria bacterium]|nr:CBS domain-containing protein [Gammaproteobacteria bacterium]